MLTKEIIIIIGLIGGIAVGVQTPIAGAMGQRIGGTASSVVVHLSGFILSAVLLLLRGGEKIRDWNTLPWYMLIAGFFGVLLFQTITIVLPRLGATPMIVLIIIGQLLTGVVLDSFGWLGVTARSMDITRSAGIALLVLGGYFIIK
jgi:transporter family-2 protein